MRLYPIFLVVLGCLAGCAKDRNETAPVSSGAKAAGRSSYVSPLSTPGYRFGSLPQPVKATVLAEAGMAEIADVVKEVKEGHVIYRIFFRDARVYPPLLVSSDGSVLHSDMSVAVHAPEQTVNIDVKDLPVDVLKVVREKASESDVTSALRETWGDHVVYVVGFKSESHRPTLYVLADGATLAPAK